MEKEEESQLSCECNESPRSTSKKRNAHCSEAVKTQQARRGRKWLHCNAESIEEEEEKGKRYEDEVLAEVGVRWLGEVEVEVGIQTRCRQRDITFTAAAAPLAAPVYSRPLQRWRLAGSRRRDKNRDSGKQVEGTWAKSHHTHRPAGNLLRGNEFLGDWGKTHVLDLAMPPFHWSVPGGRIRSQQASASKYRVPAVDWMEDAHAVTLHGR